MERKCRNLFRGYAFYNYISHTPFFPKAPENSDIFSLKWVWTVKNLLPYPVFYDFQGITASKTAPIPKSTSNHLIFTLKM